jgi:hypothetical protein
LVETFRPPAWNLFSTAPNGHGESAWAVTISWDVRDVASLAQVSPQERQLFEFEGEALEYAFSNTLKYFPQGTVALRVVDKATNRSIPFRANDKLREVSRYRSR